MDVGFFVVAVVFSESKVKVKETHCTVTELLPNAQYELWVTATNTTGISPASEKALYMTGNLMPQCPHNTIGALKIIHPPLQIRFIVKLNKTVMSCAITSGFFELHRK